MAGTVVATCPDCDKKLKVSADLAGKKVRCKACGGVIPVPGQKQATKTADTRMTTPDARDKRKAFDEDEDAKNPYGVIETSLSPRCPHCAYELDPPDARICLNCGYDMVKRDRVGSVKTHKLSFGDWMKWHLPTFGAILATAALFGFVWWYHYYLPDLMLAKKDADLLANDRFEYFNREDMDWTAVMFHWAIEVWLIVIALFQGYRFMWYAIKRLINFVPQERIKEK